VPRTRIRALQGLIFGAFATPGWAVLRSLSSPGNSLLADISEHRGFYIYLLVGAAAGFAAFGALLGHAEDALLAINRRLDDLAVSDPLTGLKNVRYFRARLEEARAISSRSGEPLTLVLLDLDRFKDVNDQHGHQAGDELLRSVANALATTVRRGDTASRLGGNVARVGGEEFAILLPAVDELEGERVAERVLKAVRAATVRTPQGTVGVSASAGVATLSPAMSSADALYACADRALYAAKAAGRDRVMTCSALAGGPLLPA
jgi:diguanylate cyclase (GGDEF)-like protein